MARSAPSSRNALAQPYAIDESLAMPMTSALRSLRMGRGMLMVMFFPSVELQRISNRHRCDLRWHHEIGLRRGEHLLHRYTGRRLDQCRPAVGARHDGELRHHEVDPAGRGERQRTSMHDLRLAPGRVLHRDDDALRTRYKVHCA